MNKSDRPRTIIVIYKLISNQVMNKSEDQEQSLLYTN